MVFYAQSTIEKETDRQTDSETERRKQRQRQTDTQTEIGDIQNMHPPPSFQHKLGQPLFID